MDDSPVTASFTWDADDFMRGVRYHRKQWSERIVRYLALWFAVIAASALFLLWRTGGFDDSALWFVILLVGGLAGFLLPNWLTRRNLVRGPNQGRETKITIGPRSVRSELTGLSDNEWSWEAIVRAVCTPDGLMLYLSRGAFLWVPDHGFASASEMDRACEVAAQSGTPVRRAV